MRNAPGKAPVIAITGTNGKSTTTALVGHILKACGFDAQIGGNIGNSVLELSPPGVKTIYVLEMSSFQIDLAPSLKPDVSLLSNLTVDHIDRHGTMENYAAIKARMLAQTASDGQLVMASMTIIPPPSSPSVRRPPKPAMAPPPIRSRWAKCWAEACLSSTAFCMTPCRARRTR
jgi:UDP-N-acetylmuramoylalanine-D-glutamate ligase